MTGHTIATAALCLLLCGCGAAATAPASEIPAAETPVPPAATERPAALAIDPAAPCIRQAAAGAASLEAGSGGLKADFDGGTGTLVLSGGEGITLPALSAAIDNPDALRELAPGEWLLGANLEVLDGASLQIAAPAVRWLKLRSDVDGFVSMTARGGDLAINGACVTSWDERARSADLDHRDGRSFLLARGGGQMTIAGAELRFLGHDANESYGLSWRLEGTGGQIVNSVVSHNYYGLYTYEVSDLVITDNEFHHNVLYGIDPHTRSHRLMIERNIVHDNGKHGIILADACADSVIRDNIVFNNLHHGIVLYQHSDRNLVEGNESYRNGAQGININQAAGNTLRANRVYENLEAGIGVGQGAQDNRVERNEIRGNQEDGIVLYSEAAQTVISDNLIADNARYGVYVDSDGGARLAGNTISGSQFGVRLKGDAEIPADANRLFDNREGDITDG